MSQTLGEKLRLAREERGISLTEVAEQTRISPHYIESIERDDYKPLPGGIFNKGFIKSFAKYVGVDEQEALSDYLRVIAEKEGKEDEDLKTYKPEVLTDDRSSRSMVPTIIIATIILGLMTAGILYGLRYLNEPAAPAVIANTNANTNSIITNSNIAPPPTTAAGVPDFATLKVEFKALSEPVSLSATNDGKLSNNIVTAGSTSTFEPKESLKLSYSKSLANVVQLTINGKPITLPAQPLVPRRNAIEFEINKANLAQIWTSGAISAEVPPAIADANVNANVAVANPGAVATPLVRPTVAPVARPAINTIITKPSNVSAKPAATSTPIIVKSAPEAQPTPKKPL